jgi:predicted alpha/beta superfamily hydrolase|tara:strand:+ start:155 stop:979 length:825 start_codon:yes stop_codon:yes gene_type:complete
MSQFKIKNTEQIEIFSEEIDQKFIINVGLPPNYSEENAKYPVVYVTDAGSNFSGLMSSLPLMQLANDLPHFILIGIDYKSKKSNDFMSLRNRDLTPTNDSIWMSGQKEMYKIFGDLPEAEPGGAKEFLKFIDRKVKPLINDKYHVNSSDQTYCGFSLGGLFGLFTLFTSPKSFNRYVIGSPSIWWDNKHILQVEEEYSKNNKELPAKIFMSIGDLEEEGDSGAFRMVTNVKSLSKTLKKRNYEGLIMKTVILEDETHCSAIAATLNRGLRSVFS